MPASGNILSSGELSFLCEQVQMLSMRIGNFIADERKKIKPSDIELKGASDFVSYVDKTAEKYFVEGLSEIFPPAGFIAEEDATLKTEERYNWIIDPLDGTTNYLHGIPCFATSVALVENGKPVIGVVFEINTQECFYAWKNGGAWMNGEKISVSKTSALQDSFLATGFPYKAQGWHIPYLELFADLQKSSVGMRRLGSAATDIAYVASGRFDGYYECGINAWDVAAGAMLVLEAGGMVTDFKGGDDFIFGRKFICGNKKVHAELLSKIQHYLEGINLQET
ncbi:inositol monophosphatase family protein [soil metagenome]